MKTPNELSSELESERIRLSMMLKTLVDAKSLGMTGLEEGIEEFGKTVKLYEEASTMIDLLNSFKI